MRTVIALLAGAAAVVAVAVALTFAGAILGPLELVLSVFIGFPLGFYGVHGSRWAIRLEEQPRTAHARGPHGAM